jgi:UDP-2,3-diacylglucosamine pyrophosphatase LpxH
MKELTNNKLWISFLPWAELRESIKLGPITFWPYFEKGNQKKITDPEIKAYLNKLFNLFVDYEGNPIDTITICFYNHEFLLNDSVLKTIRQAVDVLIFASIVPALKIIVSGGNYSWRSTIPSADNFELYFLRLPNSAQDDFISFKFGNITSIVKIGSSKFQRPFVISKALLGQDKELIAGFDKCFVNSFSVDVRERLLRSLEWFRLAHVENARLSELSKIVMMATAFEILLKFPSKSNEKKKYFVKYIKEYIVSRNFTKENRKASDENCMCIKTLAEWWASDFYNLRNKIVHGDNVSPDDLLHKNKYLKYKGLLTHLDIADLVFLRCMMEELLVNGCIGNSFRSSKVLNKLNQNNKSKDKHIESWIRSFWGFDAIYKALGWIL